MYRLGRKLKEETVGYVSVECLFSIVEHCTWSPAPHKPHIPAFLELSRQGWEDEEDEVILEYTASSRPAWAT